MVIRELPPLRLHDEITTTSGKRYRWGPDEPNGANVPAGRRDSSTMPGGFETADGTLARKTDVDYSDLERLATWRRLGVGGEVAWEGRLERAPRASGDQISISPSAVGWQAHLDDDKSASMVYVDQDLSRWQGMSRQRLRNVETNRQPLNSPEVITDTTTGSPTLYLDASGPFGGSSGMLCEAWYDAGAQNLIGALRVTVTTAGAGGSATWLADILGSSNDIASTVDTLAADNDAATRAAATYTLTTPRRYVTCRLGYTAALATDARRGIYLTGVAVFGDHGLENSDGTGVYASDVVTHAVQIWAPLLTLTSETVSGSTFVIPHLTFPDPTSAAEIVRQATRFGLQDWAVWDDKTFYWHERGARGRNWRARIGPAQLEETGPQIDRVWESVIVSYQDVDGTTRTVGPTGSGADTEDAVLKDDDPENPANKAGIIRRDLLQMGVSTAAGATEIGRRFLEQSKLLDSSGRATFTGYVQDDRGITHPYWKVRAGDTVTFVDAADTSARRIVRADNDHDARTCTVDLDSPPEGLTALLERLSVVLVPVGL